MADVAKPAQPGVRLTWLDSMKGISILWIAFFHFYTSYTDKKYPDPLGPQYFSKFLDQCTSAADSSTLGCYAHGLYVRSLRSVSMLSQSFSCSAALV